MKAKVLFSSIQKEVLVDQKNCSVLEVSIKNKIPHIYECGGKGDCTSCRVRILEGMDNLSERTEKEIEIAQSRAWDKDIRLACKSYIKGDVKLKRLVWSNAEINQLQKETIPEGKAEERSVAILFCDLRNYTKLSSANSSMEVADILNRFYNAMSNPILMNNGIIYQYVGDEIVGIFGIEDSTPEKKCMDAIRAALGMQRALQELNNVDLKQFDVNLEMGIGINFGKAYVGLLGHPAHRQFSVIGDPVNIASRIQGQTKLKDSKILISKTTFDHISKEKLNTGRDFEVLLEGKEQELKIYELLDFKQMDLQLELQSSVPLILKDGAAFSDLFYEKIFQKAPFVRELFKCNMKEQGDSLTLMLNGIVHSLARPDTLAMGLKKLGESHYEYGVKDNYYEVVKEAMLETVLEILPGSNAQKVSSIWATALDVIIDLMKSGKDESKSNGCPFH